MKKIVKLPVTWEMYGEIEIEVDVLSSHNNNDIVEIAMEKFNNNIDSINLPEERLYVESSFRQLTDSTDIQEIEILDKK